MTATSLLEMFERDEVLVAPGVFDGLSAKIVDALGFEAIYLGGNATGAATLATEPMIDMSEMCARAREITHNVDRPLIVDGDAGFGDAAHTYRAVREFANAGIAAMHIEDQVFPKRLHYHAGIKRTIPAEEMVEKIAAGLDARDDHDLDMLLIARTDAARDNRRETETIDDAIDRVNTYFEAGADVCMIFPSSMEELRRSAAECEGPILFTMVEGREPRPTTDELTDLGVGGVIYALSSTIAMADAVREVYTTLRETGFTGLDMDGFNETQTFVESEIGLPKYQAIEERSGKK